MASENLDVSRYFCYDFVLFFVIFFFFPLLCSWDDWHSEVFFVLQLSATGRCYRNVIIGLSCTYACFCFALHCVIYYYSFMYIYFLMNMSWCFYINCVIVCCLIVFYLALLILLILEMRFFCIFHTVVYIFFYLFVNVV